MNYYKQLQFIATVDSNDKITGKIEKWEAHRRGILHRCFTIGFLYKNQFVLQHRKHIAFDGYFDLTIASHQIYVGETLQSDLEAIFLTLKREWYVQEKDLLKQPEYLGGFVYKADDKRGGFTEHEYNRVYLAEIKKLPDPNYEFAYGYSLVKREDLYNGEHPIRKILTPWTIQTLNRKMI